AEQEAAEEHGLGAVAFEEGFADGEHLVALALKAPWTFEQPASALAPDQIADVVAHDGRRCGERDDQLDVQLAPAREHRGRDQRGEQAPAGTTLPRPLCVRRSCGARAGRFARRTAAGTARGDGAGVSGRAARDSPPARTSALEQARRLRLGTLALELARVAGKDAAGGVAERAAHFASRVVAVAGIECERDGDCGGELG